MSTELTFTGGTIPALPTPFIEGRVDLDGLKRVIDFVKAGGVGGLLACGTTGESPSLSDGEWEQVVEVTVKSAGGLPVLAGTGTNNTAKTLERTRRAAALGADGALVVVPYYNKPTQAGMLRHFETIASAVDLPLILYNIPGRTGANMLPETISVLARMRTIQGIKEASGDMDQVGAVLQATSDQDFVVLSGDDSLTLPLLALGGHGVISTTANVAPREMSELCAAFARGDVDGARALHYRLTELFGLLFAETNPGPLKTALELMELCAAEVRSPLAQPGGHLREALRAALGRLEAQR